ncbi:unnamed protein product [Paramecium pentaurelia]|uniref:cathepsin L n=1 Tax=Paramecium pentaurelia TaxID=43138 RepID=A0A8S1UGS0_9CILI|nr:unnamed protein product [Paramecium pentaurelia]
MQKTLLVAGLTLLLSTIGYIQNQQPVDEVSMVFEQFKIQYTKSYAYVEEAYRRAIFEQNYAKILAHNADPTQTYTVGVNQFTDLTQDEFASIYLTYTPPEGWQPSYEEVVQEGVQPNDSVDWRSQVRVKDQGSCGSCWAFSAIGAVEAFLKVTKGENHNLSEQQLVDCDKVSSGCNGGYPDKALLYIKANGSTTESSYPYAAKNQACKTATGTTKISGVQNIAKTGLQAAIKQYPISVCVDASNWSGYKSGVFSNCNKNINHAVMAVGYDASGNWIIKNSWATSWGQSGFMYLQAGDTCGVTQLAVRAI